MNRGNIVMFTGQGVYAKYFFGQFAVVMSSSISKSSKREFVRVEWLSPVKYNEGHGFGHEENRIELLKAILDFFAKCFNRE